jgi:hypothetical protein
MTSPPGSKSPFQTASTSSLPGASPLDLVMHFFETVFTGTADESPARAAEIKAIIESSFNAGYTYNGKRFSPDDLLAWRTSLLKRFPQMVFRVNSAISVPVDANTPIPTTAVAIAWTVHAIDPSGVAYELNGMNMLGMQGHASSNQQLGDAENGWRPVGQTVS